MTRFHSSFISFFTIRNVSRNISVETSHSPENQEECMASKRGIRRRNERLARLKQEEEEVRMAENTLKGGVGRTSVAELILARTKFLHPDKPAIQAVQPPPDKGQNRKPGDKTTVASPSSEKPQPVATSDPIIASARHKEMIFREAAENRDFYLPNFKHFIAHRLIMFDRVRNFEECL